MKTGTVKIIKRIVAVLMLTAVILPYTASYTHATTIFLPAGALPARRFDSKFYADYYPDLKAKYGYNTQKLLNHYLNYGIFERRLPSAYYFNNLDALGIGDLVPEALLYQRSSLRHGLSERDFNLAYQNAENIAIRARAAFPNNMWGQMTFVCAEMNRRINVDPTVKYSISVPHYSDAYGALVPHRITPNGPFECAASCAGMTRAVGLCLNILAIPYEHVNENQWRQQWARVYINGTYYAVDPYLGPAPLPETQYVKLYPPYMSPGETY
ncbi:MAG: hypothetical protein IKO16_01685 [Lachnospiraceae bacterium]|nr:hypothetical protein [Lachnospiraceae bacterium]